MTSSDWYPVALLRDLAPGTSAGTRIDGTELVVWRDDNGGCHIWIDRCPHRGMRLSLGFVRGDHIACLYHGWQYDAAGQCRYIPAHPKLEVPNTITVPTFAARETGGIVWANLAEEPGQLPADVPDGETSPVRSLFADCSLDTLIEAIAGAHLAGEPASIDRHPSGLSIRSGAIHLFGGLQPLTDAQSALHLVSTAPLDHTALGTLLDWCEAVRLKAEADFHADRSMRSSIA